MVVLLRALLGILQYMGEWENSIMNYNKSLFLLEPNIKFFQVAVITDNDEMSGFIMEYAEIRYIRMNVFETKCTGMFCDLQYIYR